MDRQQTRSGTLWEAQVGYARAVRIGNWIAVSGTTAVDDKGNVVAKNDPYGQAALIFQKIEAALASLGGTKEQIIRTRMYVTDIDNWEQIGKAHREFFPENEPAATMVEISRLIDDELLVEVEVDAFII